MPVCIPLKSSVGRPWQRCSQVGDELRTPLWAQRCPSIHAVVAQKWPAWKSKTMNMLAMFNFGGKGWLTSHHVHSRTWLIFLFAFSLRLSAFVGMLSIINCWSKVFKFCQFILQMGATWWHAINGWIPGCLLITNKESICGLSLLSLFNNNYIMSAYPFHLQHPPPPPTPHYQPMLCHQKSQGHQNCGTSCCAITDGMYRVVVNGRRKTFWIMSFRTLWSVPILSYSNCSLEKKPPLTTCSLMTDAITSVIQNIHLI